MTPSSGRWQVWTESSRYLVDLDENWVQRLRGEGMGALPDLPYLPPASDLRKDGDRIPLLEMLNFKVGESMVMLLQIRDDDVTTVRATTMVREMESV